MVRLGGTEAGLFISDGAQVSVASIYTNESITSNVYVINLSGKLSIAGDNTVLTIFASPETDASPIWMKDFDTSDNGNWTLVIEPDTVWDLDEVPVPLTHLVNNGVVKMSDLSALPEGGIAGSGLLLVDGKYYDNTGKPYKESSPSKPSKHEDKEPDTPEVVQLPFDDVVKTDWFYDAVVYVWENELMEGVADTTFGPMEPLTRAMVWTILARSEGVDTTGGSSWYAKAQEWAITNGISDGENPDMPITREQLVTMLYRLDGESEVSGTLTEPTSDWAQSAVLWAQAEKIFIGDNSGSIYPMVTTNRAEAAVVFMRWFEQ